MHVPQPGFQPELHGVAFVHCVRQGGDTGHRIGQGGFVQGLCPDGFSGGDYLRFFGYSGSGETKKTGTLEREYSSRVK